MSSFPGPWRRLARAAVVSTTLATIPVMTLLSSPAALADPIPLHLPELRQDRFPGTAGEYFNYYTFDYSVPLAQQDEHRFTGRLGKPLKWKAAVVWVADQLFKPASPLLEPGVVYASEESDLMRVWVNEAYRQPKQDLPDGMLEALREAPGLFVCVYQRRMHIEPVEFRRSMTGLHEERAIIAFWQQTPPDAFAPANLRDFPGSQTGINPLILIGPPVAACPETLGAALETLASNLPDLVPAAQPGFGETTMQAFTGQP